MIMIELVAGTRFEAANRSIPYKGVELGRELINAE
jgi:hypothetical protein